MNFPTYATLYLIALPVFFVIDLLWIGFFANDFYTKQIGHLRGDIYWPAALAFYFIFLAGITFFAIYPAAQQSSVWQACLLGAAFGFFTYAAYDLTNMATLKDWPLLMTVVDIAWGTVLGASVSSGVVYLYLLFFV